MIRRLALCSTLVFLTACAALTPKPLPPEAPPNVQTTTAPTTIEGPYKSIGAVMADPRSTWDSLLGFANQCQAAVDRCNVDKAATAEQVAPLPPAKCPWYKFGRCK